MKTKLSRLTAVLLVLCVCASLFTVTAFADNPEVITVTPNPASVTDSGDVELTAFLTISETWAKQFAAATEDFKFALTLSYPSDKGSLAVKTGPTITDGSDLFEVTSTDTNTAGKIVINCRVKKTAVEEKAAEQKKALFIGKKVTFKGTATITVKQAGDAKITASVDVIYPKDGQVAYGAGTLTLKKSSSGGGGGGSSTPTKYDVTAKDSENGKITVDPAKAASGDKVTITPNPYEGYEVDQINVTDSKGNKIDVTDNKDGTYSFTMPAGKVDVEVSFKEKSTEPEPQPEPSYKDGYKDCKHGDDCLLSKFPDLDPKAWYHDGVHFCLENGIMQGKGGGIFDPEGLATRAEVMQTLFNMEGKPESDYELTYTDVEADKWYTPAIQWATENKIVEGYDNLFRPNDPVSREELAKIFCGYAKLKGYDVTQGEDTNILSYEDADQVSSWAVPYMQWAVGAGIIKGRDEGKEGILLAPKENAKRAELATMIQRFCENVAK